MKKIMTIVGTRPEIIRLSEVIKTLDQYTDHVLVHTGQNYDHQLNQVFFDDLGLRKPNYYLNAVGKDLGETLGLIISKSYDVIKEVQPDAILILGDTNSALSAISAKRLKVPLFHMEAGNRCFDENVPEELNRRLVDHISDVNLCYTEHSRRYLLSEGLKKDYVYVTGSPIYEVLKANQANIDRSDILDRLKLNDQGYILLSAHREENIDIEKHFNALMSAINEVAEVYQLPIIYSTHPRSKKMIESRGFKFHKLVQMHEPFGYFDYNKLQKHAKVVLSDSGTLSEESAMMGFRSVLIRTSTERPEALDMGSVVVGGITKASILDAISVQLKSEMNYQLIPEYHVENVSKRVLNIILSYIPIINERIWKK